MFAMERIFKVSQYTFVSVITIVYVEIDLQLQKFVLWLSFLVIYG